jgi:hypothetical protein
MILPVRLTLGDHDLQSRVVAWQARFVDSRPASVELIASLQCLPLAPTSPTRGQTATTLAAQMDARVAIGLYEQLGDLIRSMGWQQHITGERPI